MARPRTAKTRTPSPSTPSPTPSTPPPDAPTNEAPPPTEDDSTQFVSISAELSAIGRAVDGAALLTDALTEGTFSTEAATERIPAAVVAVLGLVHARLDQVQRVLRGSSDPRRILTPHNLLTGASSPEEDPDVRLPVWTHDQRITYHSRELHMAESEQAAAASRED
jgi:hypothetical protein